MRESLRIIVSGLIAQYPLGGMAWHYLQYLVGLSRLGHDVYYLEDSGQYPYNPHEQGLAKSCGFNVSYLSQMLTQYELGDRWAYCFPWQREWHGLSDTKRREVIDSADVLLNVSGSLARPQDYQSVACLVYIDTDPVFTQVKLARGQKDFERLVGLHDVQFSFGETFSPEVPETGFHWRPTRQPVVLSEWASGPECRDVYTTVMNWTSYNDVVFKGKSYGQKDVEFQKFIELPRYIAPTSVELALNAGKTRRPPRDHLQRKGWRLADPDFVCADSNSYRHYIQSSRAEWSVAKNGYVLGQAGWFSERSACYLAAGKPVVTQETGFSAVLPTGEGLLSFSTLHEAAAAIERVESNYAAHSCAARAVAEEYFDSSRVLNRLIEQCTSAESNTSTQG